MRERAEKWNNKISLYFETRNLQHADEGRVVVEERYVEEFREGSGSGVRKRKGWGRGLLA